MEELVVITTDDLETAVRLRAAFQAADLGVELLTPSERLTDVPGDPVLLVLTGGTEGERGRALLGEAGARERLPVLGLLDPGRTPDRETCRELGYAECLPKPVDFEEVVFVGRRLLAREHLRQVTGIIGETEAVEEVLERVVQIAPVGSTVLIQGESGTGKELVARGIHALSPRRHRPFIAVNVAALPESLLESELFGHEKGAFTGASSLRKGFFELADNGTIFLDEIGEMPTATQTKLLRVLEERQFRRVGGETPIRVNVRVLTATNQSLREQVNRGDFRRDLYHRLNVLRIDLPPLRERRPDIPRLIDRFVREFSDEHDRPFPGIDADAMGILTRYDWPGNVRELRNLVESMVVLSPGRLLRPDDIPAEIRRGTDTTPSLLPMRLPSVAAAPARSGDDERERPLPQLEFVFRTLVELKMDMEDLRREFDAYRDADDRQTLIAARPYRPNEPGEGKGGEDAERPPDAPDVSPPAAALDDVLLYRPGMTMEHLEQRAIEMTLREVRGNRRRAAEMLGIGERTLYRKIKEYERE